MNRPTPKVAIPPAKPIPLPILFERALVGAVAALVVARPLVTGDDPGRLRLTSGGGPVSFNLCLLIVLVAAGVYRLAYARTRPARWDFVFVPLLLVAVGATAFVSSRLPDRYSRPGLFISWEWIALGVAVYLVRRVTAGPNDSRGLLNVLLASAVSIGGLGIYQWLASPIGLPTLDVAPHDLRPELAGNDEFYPELNRPADELKPVRGTFDSPETLLMVMLLTLPAGLAIARASRGARRGRILMFVPGVLAIAAAATLLGGAFDTGLRSWSSAFELIGRFPVFGAGPGNFSRMVSPTGQAHSAWPELGATTGLVALGLFAAAIALAVWQAWPSKSPVNNAATPASTRWEFQLGGAAGLALGFVWAFGEIPAEAPAAEVFTLGAAAVFRAVLWFAAFALLETSRPSPKVLCRSVLIGVAFVLVYGLVSVAPGRPTLLFPMFVLLAIAANLRSSQCEKPDSRWSKPWRVVGILAALALAFAYLITACLPAWSTASAVRQARMASRHFPERDREVDRAPAGPMRANALTAARAYLLANIVFPLKYAAERDPQNSALWLEVARWQRPLLRFQFFTEPQRAGKLTLEMLETAERAGRSDPNNPAVNRNQFETLITFRRRAFTRDPELASALNYLRALIEQISYREPEQEVPLRYRVVQALLDRRENSGDVRVEITTLLKLNREVGAPHGSLSPEQKADVIERAKAVIKKLPNEVVEEWRR
jgi:hypothetical protein